MIAKDEYCVSCLKNDSVGSLNKPKVRNFDSVREVKKPMAQTEGGKANNSLRSHLGDSGPIESQATTGKNTDSTDNEETDSPQPNSAEDKKAEIFRLAKVLYDFCASVPGDESDSEPKDG